MAAFTKKVRSCETFYRAFQESLESTAREISRDDVIDRRRKPGTTGYSLAFNRLSNDRPKTAGYTLIRRPVSYL